MLSLNFFPVFLFDISFSGVTSSFTILAPLLDLSSYYITFMVHELWLSLKNIRSCNWKICEPLSMLRRQNYPFWFLTELFVIFLVNKSFLQQWSINKQAHDKNSEQLVLLVIYVYVNILSVISENGNWICSNQWLLSPLLWWTEPTYDERNS